MTTTTSPLTVLPTPKLRTLAQCEAVIEAGLKGFVEAGRALDEIKTRSLYKDGTIASTWKTYCQLRWDMTSAQADRLIKSARIYATLKDSKKVPIGTLPKTESPTRPLNQVPEAQRVDVWLAATKAAGGGQPTANQVQQVVDVLKNKQEEIRRGIAKSKRVERELKNQEWEEEQAMIAEEKAREIGKAEAIRELSAQTSAQGPMPEATANIKAGKYKDYAVEARGSLEGIIVMTGVAREGADKADQGWFDDIIRYLRQLQTLVLLVAIPETK